MYTSHGKTTVSLVTMSNLVGFVKNLGILFGSTGMNTSPESISEKYTRVVISRISNILLSVIALDLFLDFYIVLLFRAEFIELDEGTRHWYKKRSDELVWQISTATLWFIITGREKMLNLTIFYSFLYVLTIIKHH